MKELLTGKCKEDFEKWVYTQDANDSFFDIGLVQFYQLTESMKYGVYVDFFDKNSLYIEIFAPVDWAINMKTLNDWNFNISNGDIEGDFYGENYETRQEAQQQAIIKANSIYNERH